MTDINDIKRELEALNAKVAAYEAEKATKRNWPERIEAGDCFEDAEEGKKWLCCGGQTCVCVIGPDLGVHAFGFREEWGYLGRDILTIRTDAHEPTGAELVGKRVNVKIYDGSWSGPVLCVGFNPERSPYHYVIKNSPSVFA